MNTGISRWAGKGLFALLFGCAVIVEGPEISAQIGGLSAEQIEALSKRAETSGANPSAQEAASEPRTQGYEGPVTRELPSRLEIFYSNRAGEPLLQFGYESFGDGRDVTLRKMGGVQENYVIGIGDAISIDLRGQENRSFRLRVDNIGQIMLPELAPIAAAGRQFSDFRAQLERQIESAYIATNVFVSVDEIRQVSVLMSGEVRKPGPLTLSGLSTSIDALLLAGGIKKSGSLRDIRVYRGDEIIAIDLYSILLGKQQNSDFSLMEGDRIHVASIGEVVAVGGWVKRPGIYELAGKRSSLTANQMIDLAGGYEVKGRYGLSLLQIEAGGTVRVVEVVASKTRLHEGDLLLAEPSDDRAQGAVHLEGHVRQGGIIALSKVKTLKALLANGDILGASVYMPFAVIARIDPASQLKSYIPFSPVEVIYGESELALWEDDVVRIFSIDEVNSISDYLNKDQSEGAGGTEIGAPTMDLGARRLEDLVDRSTREARGENANRLAQAESEGRLLGDELPYPTARDLLRSGLNEMGFGRKIDFSDPVLLSLFKESRISFFGAVKAPGDYFVMPGISLGQALEVAGGPAIQADLSSVEITSTHFESILGTSRTNRRVVPLNAETKEGLKLGPLDVVRVRQVYSNRISGSVTIFGEVRYPGRFDLMRGERLSSLMQRAGGLTSTAYPYGAVFTRISAAKAEREARNRLIDQMEGQLATVVATEEISGEGATFLVELIARLKGAPAIGRVTIEADPATLVNNGKNDTLLEPGDILTIPARPSSVSVIGEVLSPSTYQFDANFDGQDYVRVAGGFGQFADKKRSFIVMPDGRARRLNEGRWNFGGEMIAPGSTIVVPRNLRPLKWDEFLTSITQISSQLALTAASISVIGTK